MGQLGGSAVFGGGVGHVTKEKNPSVSLSKNNNGINTEGGAVDISGEEDRGSPHSSLGIEYLHVAFKALKERFELEEEAREALKKRLVYLVHRKANDNSLKLLRARVVHLGGLSSVVEEEKALTTPQGGAKGWKRARRDIKISSRSVCR